MNQKHVFLRCNGLGHAWGRQLGCRGGRCSKIKYDMAKPPGNLAAFRGWEDPPQRACTSASILVPDQASGERVGSHLLIDVGPGVVGSLAASGIPGIHAVRALLLTHWHPDHVADLNPLGESLKRCGNAPFPLPAYCHPDTREKLRARFAYEFKRLFDFKPVLPGEQINMPEMNAVVTAIEVAHTKGSLVFVVEIAGRKIVFAWDLDVPDRLLPDGVTSNLDVFAGDAFRDADLLIIDANTWAKHEVLRDGAPQPTGHASFLEAWRYVEETRPGAVGVVHMSGHEDKPGPGYGWSDREWHEAVRDHARKNPVDGKPVTVCPLLQGTVVEL